jgi:hypothetical protein
LINLNLSRKGLFAWLKSPDWKYCSLIYCERKIGWSHLTSPTTIFQEKSHQAYQFCHIWACWTCQILPPVHFIWHKLEWHGILDYTLTIHFLYTILFILINL